MNIANKIYKISRAAPLRVGAIISSSFVSIVIIYFLALRAEILLIFFICACASLLLMCSAIYYHHSFRSFRAQSLNLINVVVHISKQFQSRCSSDSAVTFWMSPKCGAVVIGFGEPYNLACKVTSQIRFIRFREPLGEQELYSILFT